MMKKKILFVINTFSRAGAELSLLSLLSLLAEDDRYELSLFVLTAQGELADELPSSVTLLNRRYSYESVLTAKGEKILRRTVERALLAHGNGVRLLPYLTRALAAMKKNGRIMPDKLFWRVLSDGAERLTQEFDLAIAFLEGGSAYYVADHVRAKRKAAFIHIDYGKAGYTRALDQECYLKFDALFPIGEQVRTQFLRVYPELYGRTRVFPNVVNQQKIRKLAHANGGFSDNYNGFRILTVGRLTEQKSYSIAIAAMRLLKDIRIDARWYVLGDGAERDLLEQQIEAAGLSDDFILLGAVENPYPYFVQADLYVHATAYEGRSIAIQEAQTLGLAVVASEANRESVEDGVDGIVCALVPEAVENAILQLYYDENKRKAYGNAAAARVITHDRQQEMLEGLLLWMENNQKNS